MPFMVLLAVPLALFGAFLALFLRGMQTDVYSQIGFVMLIGLSAKNAILIVEFAKRRRMEGSASSRPRWRPRRLRLRPILMTAFAFILGVVPLMIASGAGAASRQSIGTTVFGGMLAATILTLLFVPVFYAAIEGLRERRQTRAPGPAYQSDHSPLADIRAGRVKTGEKSCAIGNSGLAASAGLAIAAVATFAAHQGVPTHASAERHPDRRRCRCPVTAVVKRSLPVYLEYSARAESIREVSLQAKVAGYIESQPAADGADVKGGELLYKIDERDYRAALDQAKAQAQRNLAALDYARSNFRRGDELVKNGFLAKDNYDQRATTLGQNEATVAQDKAAVRTAEINLAYTEIRAPFSGRLGRNRAPVGTLVGGSGLTLNTLVQLDPIYVTFNPSERELRAIQAAREVRLGCGRGDAAGRSEGELQGRVDLHRQHCGSHDRDNHGAGDRREPSVFAASRPICAHPRACAR